MFYAAEQIFYGLNTAYVEKTGQSFRKSCSTISNYTFYMCSGSVVVGPLVCNHEITGSHPIPVRFESNVSALLERSINCTMAWVADRQVRAMLYATLAVKLTSVDSRRVGNSQPLGWSAQGR